MNSIRLYDWTNGKELPFQLSGVVFHDENRQFVKSGVLALLVDELPAQGARTYTVLWDPGAFARAIQPAAASRYRADGSCPDRCSLKFGRRMLCGG